MRGVPLPDPEEDFAADASELFFDLVYVFAIARLVAHIVHEPTWHGIAEFAVLFLIVWQAWSQFTWSANAVAGNTRPVRGLFLVAAVASVPMAASVTTAFGEGGAAFAVSSGVIIAMGLATMFVGLDHGHEVRRSLVRYSVPNVASLVVLLAGCFVHGDARMAVWIGAVVVVNVGTLRAGSDEWLVRPGHFAERHALIVIVALGEVVVALGLPVAEALEEGDGLPARVALALCSAGVFAALLWWSYFDRVSPALEHRCESLVGGVARGRFVRDVYTYGHIPLVAGLILSTAALEEITLHPTDPLPDSFRWLMVCGLALNLLAVVAVVWRAFRAVAVERAVAVPVLVAMGLVGAGLDGVVFLLVIDVVLFVTLVIEQRRVEKPSAEPPTATVGVPVSPGE